MKPSLFSGGNAGNRRHWPLDIDDVSRENIDELKAHIRAGETLDPLLVRANGKEDGRHRAHAAKELGMASVPVIDYRRGGTPARGEDERRRIQATPAPRAPSRGLSGPAKAVRMPAIAQHRLAGRETVTNRERGVPIIVSPRGINNSLQHGIGSQKVAVVRVRPELLEDTTFSRRDTAKVRQGVVAVETFAARHRGRAAVRGAARRARGAGRPSILRPRADDTRRCTDAEPACAIRGWHCRDFGGAVCFPAIGELCGYRSRARAARQTRRPTTTCSRCARRSRRASMRPPLFSGGNTRGNFAAAPPARASMRPPLFSGGNGLAEFIAQIDEHKLQ